MCGFVPGTLHLVYCHITRGTLIFTKGVDKMYCPFCTHSETKVLESRILDTAMRRRRQCLECNNRFTTYEQAEFNIKVLKREGGEEEFDLQKVSSSIKKACGKIDPATITSLSRKVHQKVLKRKNNSIKSGHIGKFVLQELKKTDKIAYLRFASVHKCIEDPKVLEKEINLLI